MTRYALKDICTELHSGKGISSSEISDAGKYPVIGGNGVRGYTTKSNFSGECAVIGRQGAACGNVRFFSGDAYMTEHAVIARGNSICDSRYLAYALGQMHLGRLSAQSAQPGLSVKTLGEQVIELPAHEEQEAIVDVLGKLDDKIALNSQINGYLAELATSRFKASFGSLEVNGHLSDIAEITMGQSPAGASYNEAGDGIVFYQGRGEFGWRYPTRRLFTTEPKRMALAGDVLMSIRAPVGDLNIAFETCCIGRGLAAIHSEFPSYTFYLMRSLKSQLDAYNGEGTVFGSINGKALKAMPTALPSRPAIEAYEGFAKPIDEAIRTNEQENRSLAQLRDALLPKLMSGEIDVSKVNLTQLNSHLSGC